MNNVIRYLENYVALLEGQKVNREPYYAEYVDKKKVLVKKEIANIKEIKEFYCGKDELLNNIDSKFMQLNMFKESWGLANPIKIKIIVEED